MDRVEVRSIAIGPFGLRFTVPATETRLAAIVEYRMTRAQMVAEAMALLRAAGELRMAGVGEFDFPET